MADYPATIPNLNGASPHDSADLVGPDVETLLDETEAVMTELGTDPAGASATVKARLDALDTSVGAKQASDSDLTAIAALSPSNDDVVQRKSGAWTNRTPAQVKTDLALVKGDVGLGSVDNTADSAKPVSTAQQAAIDASGTYPSLVTPFNPVLANYLVASGGNVLSMMRVVVPKSGTLRDLSVIVGVASGNMRMAIYDTGEALAGSRTLLYESASTAVAGASAIQTIGDPALTVTKGQHLDFGLQVDNSTATFAAMQQAAFNMPSLPANFANAPGGASAKLRSNAPGQAYGAWPATIAEASVGVAAKAFLIMARIA